MNVATLVFVIVGTSVATIATLTGLGSKLGQIMFRDAFRRGLDEAMDPDGVLGREFRSAAEKLDSVDRAVNQTNGRRLTVRVDELAASFDEMRGEVRDWRRESLSREQFADAAAVLHPEVDPGDLAGLVGDNPALTVEQIRGIARRRSDEGTPE